MNPKIRDDVQYFSMPGGIFHVYDPANHKHFRMGEQEVGWLRLVDGSRSPEELRGQIPEEYFEKFFQQVAQLGLMEGTKPHKRFDPFKIKLATLQPNETLAKMMTACVAYRQFLNATFPVLLLANLVLLPLAWVTIQKSIQSFTFSPWMVVFYIGAILISGFAHEWSHAVVAKSHGVHVPALGVMLLYLHPAFYADVSGISLLKSHRPRINVLLAGVMANNLLMSLAFAGYFLLRTHAAGVYFLYFILMNAILMLVNLTPFIEYDGYFILLELFAEPNFRGNAWRSIRTPGRRRFDYTAYFVMSNAFAIATIFLALITVRNLALRVTPALYVNYGCLALMVASYVVFAIRNARRVS